MVNERYANENEVWVISINESVNSEGKYLPEDSGDQGPGGGGNGGGGGNSGDIDNDPEDAPTKTNYFPIVEPNGNNVNFKIQKMKVFNTKEHWVSGSSEVCIRAKLTCHNGRKLGAPQTQGAEPAQYTSDQFSNYLGKLIKKVKRKDIRNGTLLDIQYSLQQNWLNNYEFRDPVNFDYTIFERDPWPAVLVKSTHYGRYSPFDIGYTYWGGGPNFNQWYRSSDNVDNSPYIIGCFSGHYLVSISGNEFAPTGLVDNGQIAFNTVQY